MPDITDSSNKYVLPHSDELTSIVLESGSTWTRVGYSGEASPRHIIPSYYGRDSNGNYSFGNIDLNEFTPGKEIYSTLGPEGQIQDWDGITKLWQHVYDNELCVPTDEQPLAITGNHLPSYYGKLAEAVFESLKVPLFSVVKQPLAACFNVEIGSALVIDIGSSGTRIAPVVDGAVLSKNVVSTRFGGDFISAHVINSIQSKFITINPPFMVEKKDKLRDGLENITESFRTYQTNRVVDEFKESTCYVSETPNLPASIISRMGPRPFEFPDGQHSSFSLERLASVEPLFNPISPVPNVSLPDGSLGLVSLITLSLANLPNELVGYLLNNIVLVGGSSLFQGLTQRLTNDLIAMYPSAKVRILSSVGGDFKNANWTGASILASMGNYEQSWVSKEEYEEFGSDVLKKRFK